jgi:YVTN family beta-propeller protein
MRIRTLLVLAALAATTSVAAPAIADKPVGPATQVTATLRPLKPYGSPVTLGNFPGGASLGGHGRFLVAVSAGWSTNDLRVVDVATQKVVQTLQIPGASGGVVLDDAHGKAYVSGEPDTDNSEISMPAGTPGKSGDVIHVLDWDPATGALSPDRTIPVPPPAAAPPLATFPPGGPPSYRSWPERLAVSADGSTLLVALGLADHAAIIDTATDAVRYVATDSHPFGAAILPDGKTGLISNRGPGTVSVIDLVSGTKTADITVGGHLSHPESITIDPAGTRAFVPLANGDAVAVIDLATRSLERTIDVSSSPGRGSSPVDASVTPDGRELLVARSAADDLAVYALPAADPVATPWSLVGRIPTADYPVFSGVTRSACGRKTCGTLTWVAAKGFGLGPNAGPPFTSQYFDIPTAFNTKGLVTGVAGIAAEPTPEKIRDTLTDRAAAQLVPVNAQPAPANTPLQPGGPIKHVFYVVRENRTYDQVLGDDPRGDGDPRYAIFGKNVTPNAHALATRFPLLDHMHADSEASIDGHFWTAAAGPSDYTHRTWRQNYAGRGYPGDQPYFQIGQPQNGFIFDAADAKGVSYANLGEASANNIPPNLLADRDRNAADAAGILRRFSKSDLGPAVGGCYDPFIGTSDLLGGIFSFDSSNPPGAPARPTPSVSRMDCFRKKFAAWVAADNLPGLVYMTLPNDHTRGAEANKYSPRAMVADNDLALGQLVDLVSHSPYWASSAIFVLEDDSQDGMDHVDAHRIPAFVISPYAARGKVVDTPYDMLAMVKSIEVILGLPPLNLNDGAAVPMYDAFRSTPELAPYSVAAPTYDLTERNPAPATAFLRRAAKFHTSTPDHIDQRTLDRVVWKTVHGAHSEPPPSGPNATKGDEG